MTTKQARKPKHVPQRTCVGCRTAKAKRELVRVVHAGGGEALVDETGKHPGRGAYLCPDYSCWREGLSRGRLAHALRIRLTPQTTAALEEAAQRYRSARTSVVAGR